MISFTPSHLSVTWADGLSHSFHPIWLRERSFEEDNKDPLTGHRLEEVAFLPPDLGLSDAVETDDVIALTFTDGHRCQYHRDDLRRQATDLFAKDLIGDKQLWDHALDTWPDHTLADLASNDGETESRALLAMLNDVARLGFARVSGVSTDMDGLKSLCDLIGPMRSTNWGTIADVKSIANAYDLSMTGRALEPHVDNPYRLPGPGYIFLHCLQNDAIGGESVIIDGFNVAERVRQRDPKAFEILTKTLVNFHYNNDVAILDHYGALIELGPLGELFRMRFHNRADQVPAYAPDVLSAYYAARRIMAEEVWSDDNTLRFRLKPGEVLVVDNYRLFHGRTAIDLATGDRHLRQCYVDRDIVSSCQKRLLRDLAPSSP